MHNEDNPSISAEDFMLELENLVAEHEGNERNMTILKSLYHYAQSL